MSDMTHWHTAGPIKWLSTAPQYRVNICQLIQHPWVCSSYHDFLSIGLLLSMKRPKQWFPVLTSQLSQFYHLHHDLANRCEIYMCFKWTRTCSVCRIHNRVLSWLMAYRRVCSKSDATGATSWARTAYLPEHLSISRSFCHFPFDYCIVCLSFVSRSLMISLL